MKKFLHLFIIISLFACNEMETISDSTEPSLKDRENEFLKDETKITTLKNGMKVVKSDNYYIYQDDMLLSEEQIQIINKST